MGDQIESGDIELVKQETEKAVQESREKELNDNLIKEIDRERAIKEYRRKIEGLSTPVTHAELKNALDQMRAENEALKRTLLRAKAQGKASMYTDEEAKDSTQDLKKIYPDLAHLF